MSSDSINNSIETLWQECRDLTPQITHLSTPPTPLQFLRNFVSPNKPLLISSSATSHWPALSLWPTNTPYLRTTLSSTPVSLHLTPNGKADSVTNNVFASAHVETVLFPEALDMVLNSRIGKNKKVAYLQQQNDCFRGEYGLLRNDCDGDVKWASEAFGVLPEAVNLWIGNGVSETSFHKDHYENMYVVVSGEKRFLLLPPTDVHRMYVREYPAASYRYCEESGEFGLEVEEPVRRVPWCSVDPYPGLEERGREIDKFPLFFNGPKPFEVTVKAGEMLYLPSMWFHHVRQNPDDTGLTIAINYWYDMSFDIKYAYFNFLQSIPHSLCKYEMLGNVESSSDISACDPEYEADIAICEES